MEKQSKYSKVQKIGQGAYGAVYRAIHNITKEVVALKISIFEDGDQGVPSTCLRQLSILKSINHPNLIRLIDADIFRFPCPRLQMAFQYLDYDLSKYLKKTLNKSEKNQKGISQAQAKKIMKSILTGLQYLHKNGILHRDLKPQNILISNNGDVKIADLGLGRIISLPFDTMSKEIQTLWYRAPQLLMGCNKYGLGVDIWSIGCIFFQLVEGKPLFQGQSEIGQLFKIFQTLGTPKKDEWPQMLEYPQFRVTFPKFLPKLPPFKKLSTQGQQFLWKIIKTNPLQRIGITQALKQRYLNQ